MFNAFAGGTAGLAVASRLSEILAFKVLVLEAGISWVPLDRVLRDVA
jgi:choline dehydrogenase-like flavoprotein